MRYFSEREESEGFVHHISDSLRVLLHALGVSLFPSRLIARVDLSHYIFVALCCSLAPSPIFSSWLEPALCGVLSCSPLYAPFVCASIFSIVVSIARSPIAEIEFTSGAPDSPLQLRRMPLSCDRSGTRLSPPPYSWAKAHLLGAY